MRRTKLQFEGFSGAVDRCDTSSYVRVHQRGFSASDQTLDQFDSSLSGINGVITKYMTIQNKTIKSRLVLVYLLQYLVMHSCLHYLSTMLLSL